MFVKVIASRVCELFEAQCVISCSLRFDRYTWGDSDVILFHI